MNEENVFVTSTGIAVTFNAILADLEQFSQSHKDPPEPMYEVKAMAGVEHHPIRDIVGTPDITPEEQAKWDAYLVELEDFTKKSGRAMIKLCLTKGVKFDPPRTVDDWIAEQEFYENEIPTSPLEIRYRFNYSMLVGSVGDVLGIIAGVARASGKIPEEMTAQAEEIFQRSVGRAGWVAAQPATAQGAGAVVA